MGLAYNGSGSVIPRKNVVRTHQCWERGYWDLALVANSAKLSIEEKQSNFYSGGQSLTEGDLYVVAR